ncbi:MAG: hypothetical protein J5865_02730 [Lachnospiraceae bacterium]|nr:hypothetical protein [Lachnospiraceae bacterium]
MAFQAKKIIWIGIVLILALLFFRAEALAEGENGWVTEEGETFYYQDGEKLKGWQVIDDARYYFKKATGVMVTGVVSIENQYYFFAEDGKNQTGWQTIDGCLHYFDPDEGYMYTSTADIDGAQYLFGEDGRMLTGWQTIGDYKYYFKKDSGQMAVGFVTISKKVYYFNELGQNQTGFQTIGESIYYFDQETGVMAVGKTQIADAFYLFDAEGKELFGWQKIDGGSYYFLKTSGKMVTGFKKLDSYTYYFNADGLMLKGWQTIGSSKYYFSVKNGRMQTGLTKISNIYYLFSDKGVMLTGWRTIGEDKYYFKKSNGQMSVGFTVISKKTYYFSSDGKLQKGWMTIDGKRYYFNADTGVMAVGKTLIGKAYYYFSSEGVRGSGWKTISGYKYYFSKSSYKMLTGLRKISNYYYYFDETGKMVKGKVTINGYVCPFATPSGKLLNKVEVPSNAKGLYTAANQEVKVVGRTGTYIVARTGYELKLEKAGFPDSYIPYLVALHKKYPDWEFVAQDTGLTWTQAVNKQYMFDYENKAAGIDIHYLPSPWYGTKAVSLIFLDEGHPASWFSNEVRSKKWYRGYYTEKQSDGYYYPVGFDSSSLTIASKAIIKYYLDPRNFMDPDGNSFFQFLDLHYDESQTAEAVKKAAVAKGSDWLSKTSYKHKNGDVVNYPKMVYNAGKAAGFNPLALLCLMTQEMGTTLKLSDGSEKPAISGTASIEVVLPTGKTETRKGYYNYFYIGGYQDETLGYNAWQRALWYASGMKEPKKNTSYGKPWNTREKAVKGGALYFKENYLDNGQNTLYTKRFHDAVHQYCTNIDAAWAEGWLLGQAYTEELRTTTTLKFYIPVYKNMPATPAAMPK